MALDKDKRIASSLPQPMVEEIIRIVEQEGDFGDAASVTATRMTAAMTDGTSAQRTAFRASGFFQGIAGTVTSEAQMLAIVAPMNALDTVNRSDTNTVWRYLGGDKAVLSNWRNEGAATQGDASAFSALTDKATADLPGINQPLATALNFKAGVQVGGLIVSGATLVRTPSAGRPTGDYNVLLRINGGSVSLDATDSVDTDVVIIHNSHATAAANLTLPDSSIVRAGPGELLAVMNNGTAFVDVSPASSVQSYGPSSYAAPIGPATGGADLALVKIPANALKPGGMLCIRCYYTKVGTASILAMGADALSAGGSRQGLSTINSAANSLTGTMDLWYVRDRADPAKIRGIQYAGNTPTSQSATADRLVAVDFGQAVTMYMAANLFTAGDVATLQHAEVIINNPKVLP